jgi:uncharacterized membrane protein
MHRCPVCKSELGDALDAEFCWNCGATLSDTVEFANLAVVRTEASTNTSSASASPANERRRLRATIVLGSFIAFLLAAVAVIFFSTNLIVMLGMATDGSDWVPILGVVATSCVVVLLLYVWASN